jgi:hypothetical protein
MRCLLGVWCNTWTNHKVEENSIGCVAGQVVAGEVERDALVIGRFSLTFIWYRSDRHRY